MAARDVSDFEPVIGLEVHAQLKTRTKLFCGCPNAYGSDPNSNTCPVCLGLPGALPRPNREAVRLAARFASAIGSTVHSRSVWARKNYFYPDLPKGYQISQFDQPIATGGAIRIEPEGRPARWIPLHRVHLEEDAGKSVHEGFAHGNSGIDLNRCGVPLIEIVGEAEIHDPDEAYLYLERLKSILRATGVCDADMEKGFLRCDANVSVHRRGTPWGTRVEIKNLNSFRNVRRALQHEIARQLARIAEGGEIVQETRLWNDGAGETRPMRSKEEAHDYRYFPDPDLPVLEVDDGLLAAAVERLPEPVHERRDRYADALGLGEADAHRLTVEHEAADYFEAALAVSGAARPTANWVLVELAGRLNADGLGFEASPLPAARLGTLVALVQDGTISGKAAKAVFDECYASGAEPLAVVEARGLRQVSDVGALEGACREVLDAHPEQVAQFRAGKEQVLGFLVGRVMRAAKGANPGLVNEVLRRLLAG